MRSSKNVIMYLFAIKHISTLTLLHLFGIIRKKKCASIRIKGAQIFQGDVHQ